jgi:hypothetical protein
MVDLGPQSHDGEIRTRAIPTNFPTQSTNIRAKRNVFPLEEVNPDWKHAMHETGKAGHWIMDEFSEDHMAERKFTQTMIYTPEQHLAGSYQVVVQDSTPFVMKTMSSPNLKLTLQPRRRN